MFCDFKTTTHGKWILTGEHAVIRGYHALVFPLLSKTLELEYSAETLPTPWDNQELLQILLQRGFEFLQPRYKNSGLDPKTRIPGSFKITNTIPMASGLGASAALCVSMARWFIAQGYETELLPLAQYLEHFFHGHSSGVDIIGSSSTTPMDFQKNNSCGFMPVWQPCWGLSYSGYQSSTKHCVSLVEKLKKIDAGKAHALDEQMQASTLGAKQALLSHTAHAVNDLSKAIQLAKNCFQQWGLIHGQLEEHLHFLLDKGALAAKPTGSGAGGYVLSLWDSANSFQQIDNSLRLF